MKKKHSLLLFTVCILALFCSGFTYKNVPVTKMLGYLNNNKFDKVEKFLKKNEEKLKENPDYYVVLLNYSLLKNKEEYIELTKEPIDEQPHFALTTANTTAGYITAKNRYDNKSIIGAIRTTQKALNNFNNRLDIHFGIIAVAKETKNTILVSEQLSTIIKVSKEIDNQWTWGTIGRMSGSPKQFMLDNIQFYLLSLYKLNTKEADTELIKVSTLLIEEYPNLIYGYSNLGNYYMATNDFEQAENYFKKALSIKPNDETIIYNLKKLKQLKNK